MLKNVLLTLSLIAFVYISFTSESATAVQPKKDGQFSAIEAAKYLPDIASKTHPIGSYENIEVRDYIIQELRKEGLEVRLQRGYVHYSWKPTYSRMAYVENIIATLKGSNSNGKKVVIAGHYDSVFEGPGAADDGYAVACMIETAKMLKSEARQNDIELLITDGEEMGLLGAQYYAQNSDLSDIGIILNYEARGNAGPGIAFEFSDDNAWLIDEMSKVSKRPIASSLSYEIYKRMPNATDYTVLKDEGVPGINYAFIDGFSYYHNPADNIDNLSLKSVQHTGENMYLMARHFANFDFTETPVGNASFFNFYGNLIHYSADMDLYLLLLISLLLGYTCYRLFKQKEVTAGRIGLGFLGILATIILCGGLSFGLAYIVKNLYPQYSIFYSYQYYNHEWYLLASIGLTLLVCWALGARLLDKLGSTNMGISTAVILLLLSVLLYSFIPTATYLMMFPLLALTAGLLLTDIFKIDVTHWQSLLLTIGMLSVFPALWTTFTHGLFLGFSFTALPATILPVVLLCFATLSLYDPLWKKKEMLIPILGISLFSYAMINAHMRSQPTEEAPLPSNLFFVTDVHAGQSYWATKDRQLNAGHLNLLNGGVEGRLSRHLPFSNHYKESNLKADKYRSFMEIDTLDQSRNTQIRIYNQWRAGRSSIVLEDVQNVKNLIVNGSVNKEFAEGATGYYRTDLFGIGQDSMKVEVVKRDTSLPARAYINMSYQEPFARKSMPENIVRSNHFTYVSDLIEF